MGDHLNIAAKATEETSRRVADNVAAIRAGGDMLLSAAADFDAAGTECIKVVREFRMAVTHERDVILKALTDIADQMQIERTGRLLAGIATTIRELNAAVRDPGLTRLLYLLRPLIEENTNNAQGASPAHTRTENDQ
ncbi:MAG: hypothetical protein ACHQ1G_05785 [Planctomycetota bacterium]